MPSIIGVGDNTVDTYIHQRMRYPGGNAVNVAVLAHRYGAEPAAYLGWLGSDANGRLVFDSLQQEGLDLSRCRVVGGPNAYSTVELVDGDRVFGPADHGVTAQIYLTEDDYDYIRGFDVVHTSVYSHIEPFLPRIKQSARRLTYDFSQERRPEYLERVMPYVDIALLSCSDLSLAEQESLMRHAHNLGALQVLVTRGGEGAWVFDGQQFHHQDVVPVQVVDTLGAGDAFAARFLYETANGVSIPEAMQLAAQSAAENCTIFGAFGYAQPM